MDNTDFDRLLLRTAFSCMACDGDIDMREVRLIKELHRLNNTFGAIDIEEEMNNFLDRDEDTSASRHSCKSITAAYKQRGIDLKNNRKADPNQNKTTYKQSFGAHNGTDTD